MDAETTIAVSVDSLELRDADDGSHELVGICVPFDTPTMKAGPRPELFARDAFPYIADGVGKVRLTDENHAEGRRPVGVARAFEQRAAGLWSRFRFYGTTEGRNAWENVREGTYGGLSVGFVAVRDAIVDGVRVIREAKLHHVSLVDEPAYDDAVILAVRAADPLAQYANLRRRIELPLDVRQDPDFTDRIARLTRRGTTRST